MNVVVFRMYLIRTLFVLFFLMIIAGCIEREKAIRNQALWSSKDPITIPYHIRLNQLQKGNLVFNPSFETGKIFFEEGEDNAFFVRGWNRVGEQVEWVDLSDPGCSKEEVSDGNHAIKIHREKSSEMEETGELH